MTTDDQPAGAPSADDDHPGPGRYGARGLGRNDPSLYGRDLPGAPPQADDPAATDAPAGLESPREAGPAQTGSAGTAGEPLGRVV